MWWATGEGVATETASNMFGLGVCVVPSRMHGGQARLWKLLLRVVRSSQSAGHSATDVETRVGSIS